MKTTVSIIFNTQNRAWVNIWKKWWWILKFKAYNEMKVVKCRLKHNVPNIQVGKLLVQTLTNICYSHGEICMRPVKCYISREKSGQTVEMTNVGRAMSRTVRSDTSLSFTLKKWGCMSPQFVFKTYFSYFEGIYFAYNNYIWK